MALPTLQELQQIIAARKGNAGSLIDSFQKKVAEPVQKAVAEPVQKTIAEPVKNAFTQTKLPEPKNAIQAAQKSAPEVSPTHQANQLVPSAT